MIKNQIIKNLQSALKKIGIKTTEVEIDHPANSDFGDYSTSIALKLAKKLKKNPFLIAQSIVNNFPKSNLIEKIETVRPGFINFRISLSYLINQLNESAKGIFLLPQYYFGGNKKVMVEFAQPNTHKLFHIGHLRNISIGESLVRILEAVGNKVIRTNYQGDVGLHIAKCLYRIKNLELRIKNLKTLKEKIELLGRAYSEGQQAYETDEKAKDKILEINKQIYQQDPKIIDLWKETVGWSLKYFDQIYKRVGSHFDRLYFESELYQRAIEICQEAYKKGILEKSQGAIIFNGKKYGLDTRVFINSQGFPTYEGKELALAEKEFTEFGELDKNIHVVSPEQTSFFKVTFKVEELLNEKKYKNKQYHLAYEWVRLKTGKMSSRIGNVIEVNWLIDQVKKKIISSYKCSQQTAEILAVGAIKYSFLKHSAKNEIAFDIDESIQLEGNSAPYLIYTYVRCQSVLKKTPNNTLLRSYQSVKVEDEENNLLRIIYQFPEVVENAAKDLAANYIANYLFDLAQKYNLFYQKYPILKADEGIKKLRLLLTQATAQVIKKGLELLGIKTVEKM